MFPSDGPTKAVPERDDSPERDDPTVASMVDLHPFGLHWTGEGAEQLGDQCLHGGVMLKVNGQTLLRAEDDVTLTAAALFLLRTLHRDHIRGSHRSGESDVTGTELLFPHCGFTVLAGDKTCGIIGCDSGYDLGVRTESDRVTLSTRKRSVVVARRQWELAVRDFAARVRSFYGSEPPRARIEDPEEAAGWEQFWNEFAVLTTRGGV